MTHSAVPSPASQKLCKCGCGQATKPAQRTDYRRGVKRGVPQNFIKGHENRGRPSPAWRGGRSLDSNGYVGVWSPEHPRATARNYVPEHVLVAEKALGKVWPANAMVHHVNGIRTDNRPTNLVVCESQAYHLLLHQRQRALDTCGKPTWLKCTYCKEYDAPQNLVIYKRPDGGINKYHSECRRSYECARAS